VRLTGLEGRRPVRIVADGRLRLPLTSALVMTAREQPTWLLTRQDSDRLRREAFAAAGVEVIALPARAEEQLDLKAGLRALGARGLTRVLAEGGGVLAAGLLRAGLVDRLALYRAPLLLGADARPAIAALGLEQLAGAPAFRLLEALDLGPDRFELYARR
jgi:diaminohydroxyphosphoribosylaminopyrimidine deaminase/5-amino-6-(5-phosphoribosylamino)uracil reductase